MECGDLCLFLPLPLSLAHKKSAHINILQTSLSLQQLLRFIPGGKGVSEIRINHKVTQGLVFNERIRSRESVRWTDEDIRDDRWKKRCFF